VPFDVAATREDEHMSRRWKSRAPARVHSSGEGLKENAQGLPPAPSLEGRPGSII
jgi:hypothetical protein